MAKNALIICNFRLRNIEQFEEIITKFRSSKYDIYEFGEIDRENFEIESLEKKLNEIRSSGKQYENIALISNIKDLLFIWYRVYNKVVDKFLFFIDRVNYSILKRSENSELFTHISEFYGIENEDIKGKIYININYENYNQIFEFLFKDFKFRYFDRMENLVYFEKNRVNLKKVKYKKRYIFNEESYSFGEGEEKIVEQM